MDTLPTVPPEVLGALARIRQLAREAPARRQAHADARADVGRRAMLREITDDQARAELAALEPYRSAWQLWLAEQMEQPGSQDPDWLRWIAKEYSMAWG